MPSLPFRPAPAIPFPSPPTAETASPPSKTAYQPDLKETHPATSRNTSPHLPLELHLLILHATLPPTLDLSLGLNNLRRWERSTIQCTNSPAWSTTRAMLALSPAIARATGWESYTRYNKNRTYLRVKFSNCTDKPTDPVPDGILVKFERVEIEVPMSLAFNSPGAGGRREFILATLTCTLDLRDDETWRTVDQNWEYLSPPSLLAPHAHDLSTIQATLSAHLRSGMNDALEGPLLSGALDVFRDRLAVMFRGGGTNQVLVFPWGWQLQGLDRTVETLETWRREEALKEAWRRMFWVLVWKLWPYAVVLLVLAVLGAIPRAREAWMEREGSIGRLLVKIGEVLGFPYLKILGQTSGKEA